MALYGSTKTVSKPAAFVRSATLPVRKHVFKWADARPSARCSG